MNYNIILLIAFVALMYFLMIRPQQKQAKKRQEMINTMNKGAKIVTIGGLHGVIDSIDTANNTVTIDADGVFLTFDKASIRTVAAAPVASTVAGGSVLGDSDNKVLPTDDAADSAASDDATDDKD
ncbi:MAG: preprotein translocase subunit YajC [Lactobacillaceae bacterium]|jgi:preprotein translocase subunit YajC|nr:preprotein translocase subunit YajC [Lactobacillaceae bacterium]